MATPTMDNLIRFRCQCGKKLKASPDIVGKKVQCTKCPRTHRVPEFDQLGPQQTVVAEPTAKSNTTKTSPPKTKRPKEKTADNIRSKNVDVAAAKSNKAVKTSSLVIHDEMASKEPSLIPGNDSSDSRFKLDPKLDPKPSEDPLAPKESFEFDFDASAVQINTAASTRQSKPSPQALFGQPKSHRPANKSKIIAGLAAALGVLLLVVVVSWLTLGSDSYPAEFSERPEVKNYVAKIKEFRKSQQTLQIASEAYVKSKSPAQPERDEIEAFNRSIEPLANEDEKLAEALELFQTFQPEKARSTLISAIQTLDQKIPELEAKAKDFSSKLR